MNEQFDIISKDHRGIDAFKDFTTKGLSGDIYSSFSTLDSWIIQEHPGLPVIYCKFINDTTLNAVVRKSQNSYFIGINIGTFYILQDLFYRMLSQNSVLMEFGDSFKEINPQPLVNTQISDLNTLIDCRDPYINIVPKNPKRQDIANLLTGFTINLCNYMNIIILLMVLLSWNL